MTGETVKCCIAIPSLQSNVLFIHKYIRYISPDDTTAKVTIQNITSQLDALKYIDATSPVTGHPKLKVQVFVFVIDKSVKLKTNCKVEGLSNQLHKALSTFKTKFSFLEDICLTLVNKPNEHNTLDEESRKNIAVILQSLLVEKVANPFLCQVVGSIPVQKKLRVLNKKVVFEGQAGLPFFFDEHHLKKFQESYFRNWKNNIVTIPDFDRIKGGLLYQTDPQGSLNLRSGNEFVGEMQNFWVDFMDLLKSPTGLLLRSYNEQYLSSILECEYEERFQIDWLYCSSENIIAIEVGRTINPREPVSTVKNKIIQCFTKIIPKMQFIIWNLLEHLLESNNLSPDEIEERILKFLHDRFKIIIYFPNISKDRLLEVFPSVWADLPEIISVGGAYLRKNQVYFLVQHVFLNNSEAENKLPKMLKLQIHPNQIQETVLEELDVATLHSLFSVSAKLASAPRAKDKYLAEIASLLAIGYFLDKSSLTLEKFCKVPLTNDERFQEDHKKVVQSKELLKSLHLEQLKITLSPQQHRILTENKKCLLTKGEPGSGKTVLLLAKAYVAGQDHTISHIYYYAPKVKTALREEVDQFVNFPKYREFFHERFKYLSDHELFDLENKSFKELQNTVLLIDEIYFEDFNESKQPESNHSFSCKFFKLSQKVFPFLRNCWMSNIVASSVSDNTKTLSRLFLHELFSIEALNVQFRSSSHIGFLSTNNIHDSKDVNWFSVRMPGTFIASQTKVTFHEYSSIDAINLQELQPDLKQDRWAIVFCNPSDKSKWLTRTKSSKKFRKIFITSSAAGYHDCEFSGGQAVSVVVIIDHVSSQNSEKLHPVYNLAMNRAQCNLNVYVNKKYPGTMSVIKNWTGEKQGPDKFLMFARQQLPIDYSDAQLTPETVDKLYGIAITYSDITVLNELRKYFPNTKPSIEAARNLRGPKDEKFLKKLSDGSHEKEWKMIWMQDFNKHSSSRRSVQCLTDMVFPEVMETILNAVKLSCLHLLVWIFKIMGNDMMFVLQKYPVILLHSCFTINKEILEFCIAKLRNFSLLEKEIQSSYDLWGDKTTLVTLICFVNNGAESLRLILKHGFPDELLSHRFLGKNALQYAIEHNNIETIKALLSENPNFERLSVLMSTPEGFRGQEFVSYAKRFGFHEIAQTIQSAISPFPL